MSKRKQKRPTEASWDSDDDLLKEDAPGVSAFSRKGDDEDIDEDTLLQLEGDEEIGDGDTFQILDPESAGFDESIDLGLETSQNEQEALDYEDTVQEDTMDGMTDTDQSFSEITTTQIKTEPLPMTVETIPPVLPNQGGLFKEMKKEDSDSDEDKGDHRERFKSERKMISLVSSSKYSKPIPDSLEVTAEMQEEINKFEKTKAPVKQRLGQRTGPQNRPQNQRQNQGQFGARFPGNQNIRGPGPNMRGQGPRRGKNQNYQQRPIMNQQGPRMNQQGPRMNQQGPRMNLQEQFHPGNMEHQHRQPRPMFPHEMNMQQGQGQPGNQFGPPGPGPLGPNQDSLLGPGPPMMQVPDEVHGQNIHYNPQFFGRLPRPEGFPGQQPQPFNQGQMQLPPHSQPGVFPREAWPPHQTNPSPERFQPPQHQPPFSGPQPPYPPASTAFTPRPGPQQPLIPTSGIPHRPPHYQQPQPLMGPQQPPYPMSQGGPQGQPSQFQGPNPQPPRFMPQQPQRPQQPRPDLNQTPPELHIRFNNVQQQGQRPQNLQNQGGQFRPQTQNQIKPQPQGQNQMKPQNSLQFRSVGVKQQARRVIPPSNQNRPLGQVVLNKRGRGALGRGFQGNNGTRLTGVGRGIAKQQAQQAGVGRGNAFKPFQQQKANKIVIDARQRLAMAQIKNSENQGFNPRPINVFNKTNNNVPKGEMITVVNSRGVKRQSGEATNVVPIKQAKQEEVVPMETTDPELQRALEEQKRQREAIRAKKEQNRLATANKRRKELEEKKAIEEQGQKISVLGTQYPSVSQTPSQTPAQFTNIVQVQTTPQVMTGPPNAAGAASQGNVVPDGQFNTAPTGQTNTPRFNVGRGVQSPGGQTPRLRGRGRGRGKRQRSNTVPNPGFDPGHEVNIINQPEQQFQQHTPMVQANEAKQIFKDSFHSTPGQGHNQPNIGQGQNKPNVGQGLNQKGQVRLVRSDKQGNVIGTYSAMPTKNDEGKVVYKLKVETPQNRIVQATPSPPSKRTVVASSSQARQIVADSNTSEPEPSRTVVATGRTIGIGRNPHLRSRKVSVEGLTSTTQKAKLLDMVSNVGLVCEDIKFIPAQRRAILTFGNIEMATVFVKKYNRTMVDLTHIQVKEVPE